MKAQDLGKCGVRREVFNLLIQKEYLPKFIFIFNRTQIYHCTRLFKLVVVVNRKVKFAALASSKVNIKRYALLRLVIASW